ncbi:MAG: T9SS type A sorting domain-containing protein [Bacteroidota bacterium]|nr:T9SS type A sorting domain-containing protein [Bacteroidota bacterium]
MKTLLLLIFSLFTFTTYSQITTPIIKANFGVDADLRANYFNNFNLNGNDDWFSNGSPGFGEFVIDTTGAAFILNRYNTTPSSRHLPFFRTMRHPQYSIINNRLWIDAVMIRDYHGGPGFYDSTAFVSSNKNGQHPNVWTGGAANVLDKNDIADMFVHVRRAGPTKYDSLWFLGGISLQGTSGNRYFDFELYQTDIFYSRTTGKFSGYGPDEGHTSWQFDASGNIIAPGDVIFSAEYSSQSLSALEARIWVHKDALNITPASFIWTGSFDGASNGSTYGYAGIRPKTVGDFYTGMQSSNNTWAGPFGWIRSDNTVQTLYGAANFMEFSVNMTKLGLDPITLLGGSACGLPFRRILVKTRSSVSFSAELKDFIGPFDFFVPEPVLAAAESPFLCETVGTTRVQVVNPNPLSVYRWTTPDGNIVGDTVGSSVYVDAIGSYIVSHELMDGCATTSTDTVSVYFSEGCIVLSNKIFTLNGSLNNSKVNISWNSSERNEPFYVVQRSFDGKTFNNIGEPITFGQMKEDGSFSFLDAVAGISDPVIYYRLLVKPANSVAYYSKTIKVNNTKAISNSLKLYPNPALHYTDILLKSHINEEVDISVLDFSGRVVYQKLVQVSAGQTAHTLTNLQKWKAGLYMVVVKSSQGTEIQKFVLSQSARVN